MYRATLSTMGFPRERIVLKTNYALIKKNSNHLYEIRMHIKINSSMNDRMLLPIFIH